MVTYLLAASSAIVAPVPEAGQFGDWTVACDNVRYCEAMAAFERGGSEGEWTIHVSRGAEAQSLPELEAVPAFGEPIASRLRIDGRISQFGFDSEGTLVGNAGDLLKALARARQVEAIGLDGNLLGEFPVTGASAALRWIDDRQRRAGTVTALIATGPRPASDVPLAPPLPRINQPPPSSAAPKTITKADVEAIRALGDCEADAPGLETHRLDATHTVGIIGCIRGAYQGSAMVVVIDEEGRWAPAPIEQPVPVPEDTEVDWRYQLTEADFSTEDRLLREWAKGRGLADCGMSASWTWDGGMFRLTSYRSLEECRGAPPGAWLSRWQTANDPLLREE